MNFNFGTNWKTSITGIAAIMGSVAQAVNTKDYISSATGILAGLGLLFAKDSNVTGGAVKQTP